MEYTEHPVPAALLDTVRCLWTLHGGGPPGVPEAQPVLPDGHAELIINLADPFEERIAGTWQEQPRRFLYGQITKAIHLRPQHSTAMIGVRFQPWGVYGLFGPQAVCADAKLPLALIDPAWDRELDALSLGGSTEVMPRIVQVLVDRPKEVVDRTLLKFIHAVWEGAGGALDPLKAEAALSERQLERRFRAVVGLRPKQFARIIRLRRLVELVQAGDRSGFAALAHAAGYFDPAHFNRELKAYTGMAPRAYFGQDLMLPEYFSGVR